MCVFSKVSAPRFSVDLEEHTNEGKHVTNVSLEDVQATLLKLCLTGVRVDERTRLEQKVVGPRLDKSLKPVHRLMSSVTDVVQTQSGAVGFSRDGAAKKSHNGPRESRPGQYGEDCAGFDRLFSDEAFGQLDWIFLADGHGGLGAPTAALARRLFREQWQALAEELCCLTREGHVEKAVERMQIAGYDKVVPVVEAEAKQQGWTGSTVTQMLTVTTPEGRRVAYSSNMGDSPSAIVLLGGKRAQAGPKVYRTSCAHSWEDEDEIKRYVQHVWQLREQRRGAGLCYENIKPQPVCYHTFNCSSSGAVLKDLDGNEPAYDSFRRCWTPGVAKPIPMWRYTERRNPRDGELQGWDVELDAEAAEHVTDATLKLYGRDVMGGVQAPAARELLVVGADAKPFRPLVPNQNWGSCVLLGDRQRGCQATRGLCDFKERDSCYTDSSASFMAFEIFPDETVLQMAMSDGVADIVGLQELAEHLAPQLEHLAPDEAAAQAAGKIMALVKSKREAEVSLDTQGEERPGHDDCSVAVAFRAANEFPDKGKRTATGATLRSKRLRTHEG